MADTPQHSKSDAVRKYLKAHPRAKNKTVASALASEGVEVNAHFVAGVRRRAKKKKRGKAKAPATAKAAAGAGASTAKYPRHSLDQVLRIPRAILDQHAGKACTVKTSASLLGLKSVAGSYQLEVSSAKKYGLLESPSTGNIKPSNLARRILRPQSAAEELDSLREAVLNAPGIANVYSHYRGENLPDEQFFRNTLIDTFRLPQTKTKEFRTVFLQTLKKAKLLEEREGKQRVLDVTKGGEPDAASEKRLKKLGEGISVTAGDTCFVMMPFAPPHGEYYSSVYEPAIKKAGLTPVRADDSIFGAGKIMDQVWAGINAAIVLVTELTTKNPNVFYELGLAHALEKPVVLVSSNENDVPFDLQHIRVIYYDVNDPFWGPKLIEKVAENILSAIKNPEEAIFKGGVGKN